MKSILILVFLFMQLTALTQEKKILVYDLVEQEQYELDIIQNESQNQSDESDFYIGLLNNKIAFLDESLPVECLYGNSLFSQRKIASNRYSIDEFPLRAIGRLFYQSEDTLQGLCSGTMVSKRHYLTAAHCITSHNTSELIGQDYVVCPGYDNGNIHSEMGCVEVSKIYVVKNWASLSEDIALLELKEPIGLQSGWLSLGFNQDDDYFTEGTYYKFTYPANYIPIISPIEYNGDTLNVMYGQVDAGNENSLTIQDTRGINGESGSALVKIVNNQQYTCYGALSYSLNLSHSRIQDWMYYSFQDIIKNDITLETNDLEPDFASFHIYPNPTQNNIIITEESLTKFDIDLFSENGKIIQSLKHCTSPYSLDLTRVQAGTYILRISSENGHSTQKVIKR